MCRIWLVATLIILNNDCAYKTHSGEIEGNNNRLFLVLRINALPYPITQSADKR